MAMRVIRGSEWMANRRSWVVARRRVRIGFHRLPPGVHDTAPWADALPGRGSRTLLAVVWPDKGIPGAERKLAHEAWRTRWLLGTGHGRGGSAHGRAGGRAPGLRLGVVGRGLRLGCRHSPGLAGRPDQDDPPG